MIEFKPIDVTDKVLYESYHTGGNERGCEYSFANLNMWGKQNIAEIHGHLAFFSSWGGKWVYPFPLGKGDKKPLLDAIIADARERGISLHLTGVYDEEKAILEELYPDKFLFMSDEGTYDYVYDINDLADLKGRKYHSKRNHIHRFKDNYPDYTIQPITKDNLSQVKELIDNWYEVRTKENPDGDYEMEKVAVKKALENYRELEFEGLLLKNGEDVLAVTLGSRMYDDTFDVHFEKAKQDVDGAYTVINCEFAKYIRSKYPEVKFLDREEDMGIEGLRKAKQSYKPHHMIKKYWAFCKDDAVKAEKPQDTQIPELRALWKEAFGDGDEFLDTFFSVAYSKERCRCITVDGEIAAALYWFRCECRGKALAYIYAVATSKKMRGQGLCHKLMEDTHRHLKSLGFEDAVLVPGSKELFDFYSGMGYKVCSGVKEFCCDKAEDSISVRLIDKNEYAKLRQEYLPDGGVTQELENLDFLEKQAKFYAGEGFVLAAREEDSTLVGIELLGNEEVAPMVVNSLGYEKGTFRTVGKEKDFAMHYHLGDNSPLPPQHFGLAFD